MLEEAVFNGHLKAKEASVTSDAAKEAVKEGSGIGQRVRTYLSGLTGSAKGMASSIDQSAMGFGREVNQEFVNGYNNNAARTRMEASGLNTADHMEAGVTDNQARGLGYGIPLAGATAIAGLGTLAYKTGRELLANRQSQMAVVDAAKSQTAVMEDAIKQQGIQNRLADNIAGFAATNKNALIAGGLIGGGATAAYAMSRNKSASVDSDINSRYNNAINTINHKNKLASIGYEYTSAVYDHLMASCMAEVTEDYQAKVLAV